jgi:hypothetical protein
MSTHAPSTDNELITQLDTSASWISPNGWKPTLRKALQRSYELHRDENRSPGPLKFGEIEVQNDQILRLWKLLGFEP